MTLADFINAVPDIERKSYLEIGVAEGTTFNQIRARVLLGVDPDPESVAQRHQTSDEFFEVYWGGPPFDVIFIDGDHSAGQVARDINNARRVLGWEPPGVIFVHDLVPPDIDKTAPDWCGDGYRVLDWCIDNGVSFVVLAEEYGLTRFDGLDRDVGVSDVGYEEFVDKLGGVPVVES